jgi:hypothetical protein
MGVPTLCVDTRTSKLSHSANGAEYSRDVCRYEAGHRGNLALSGWSGKKSRICELLLPPEGD